MTVVGSTTVVVVGLTVVGYVVVTLGSTVVVVGSTTVVVVGFTVVGYVVVTLG